jgi:hypothetical protein
LVFFINAPSPKTCRERRNFNFFVCLPRQVRTKRGRFRRASPATSARPVEGIKIFFRFFIKDPLHLDAARNEKLGSGIRGSPHCIGFENGENGGFGQRLPLTLKVAGRRKYSNFRKKRRHHRMYFFDPPKPKASFRGPGAPHLDAAGNAFYKRNRQRCLHLKRWKEGES